MAQISNSFSLTDEALRKLWLACHFRRNDFNRHLTADIELARAVNCSHTALPNLSNDLILAKLFAD